MIESVVRLSLLGLLVAAIAGAPARLAAQSTNKTAAAGGAATEKPEAAKAEKKKSAHPFRGKLAKLDKVAKTIKVGQSVYQITSDTKIKKDGKPATLQDGVEGELVTGYAKPNEEGKMVASSVNFGGPQGKQGTAKSSDKSRGKSTAGK